MTMVIRSQVSRRTHFGEMLAGESIRAVCPSTGNFVVLEPTEPVTCRRCLAIGPVRPPRRRRADAVPRQITERYRSKKLAVIAARQRWVGECLEWTARRNDDGYGLLYWQGANRGAHRVIWELHHGVVPEGLLVCHTCDNPPCGRLDHLYLGTHAQNMQDKIDRGRWRGREPRGIYLVCANPACGVTFRAWAFLEGIRKYCSRGCYDAVRCNHHPVPEPKENDERGHD